VTHSSTLDMAGTDPFAVIPPNDNTASLRIFNPYKTSLWQTIQDQPDSAVLDALASTGGLWTFINGAFGFIFGGGILLALSTSSPSRSLEQFTSFLFCIDARPKSMFGLVHQFYSGRIRDNLKREFPLLEQQAFGKPSDGMSAFLAEYIVNLDVLKDQHKASSLHDSEHSIMDAVEELKNQV
jgi:hypothetical protein